MAMIRKLLLSLAAPAALLLSGCAPSLTANVQRFSRMPAPEGQSFVIQAARDEHRGGIEFGQYADHVRRNLIARGYREASSARDASLIVTLDYGVDGGRERIQTWPTARGWGYGAWGRPYFSRFGYLGYRRHPFFWGWHDPFFGDPWGQDVTSYTVYTSFLELDIRRAADREALFEGHAEARSTTNELPTLVPNLIEAMFTNFPGNNGERVRITVTPERERERERQR